LGHFTPILQNFGVPFQYHDLGDPIPAASFSALIVLGGPMSANDDLPGIKDELNLIERELQAGTPTLGICLGSQLIAKVLGARVYRNSALEIGWKPVFLTDAAKADPVFSKLPSPAPFFHWHSETFDLPSGAEWLAWSDQCRHQAYRYGDNVYAVQFHPEITAEMIADWQRQPVNCGDVATLDAPIDPCAYDSEPLARSILERWLSIGLS
jgi:GMP synthase (glutamine-hydrolysing)